MAFTERVDAGINLLGLTGVGKHSLDLCAWPGHTMSMETGLFHQSYATVA